MKLTWILFAAAIPALSQQPAFDFKSLDKLGANAKDSTSINLEGDNLKAATALIGDKFGGLTGIYVHSYEFAKAGQYNEQDLAPFRAYLKSLNWAKVIDVKDGDETSEVDVHALPDGKIAGMAVFVVSPRELTIVFLSGVIDVRDLQKLQGLGIPEINLNQSGKYDAPKKD